MNLETYKTMAMVTADYPHYKSNLLYPSLGLLGETGEALNTLKKMLRDDKSTTLTKERRLKLKGELGDVMWYIANIAHHTHSSLQPAQTLVELAIQEKPDIFDAAFKMMLRAHELSRLCLAPDDLRMSDAIIRMITAMDEMCTACSLTLDSVTDYNIEKLASRAERGTIGGDGNDR
jgi:NTP pyrophosphatase (non-canonical NTP hydrolase)